MCSLTGEASHRVSIYRSACGLSGIWQTEQAHCRHRIGLADWLACWCRVLGLHSGRHWEETGVQHQPLHMRRFCSYRRRHAQLHILCCNVSALEVGHLDQRRLTIVQGRDLFCWSRGQLHPRCNKPAGVPSWCLRLACHLYGCMVGCWLHRYRSSCLGIYERL